MLPAELRERAEEPVVMGRCVVAGVEAMPGVVVLLDAPVLKDVVVVVGTAEA